MPDDLDPTTARLVSELAAMILPSLTKSLSSAIPANDFSGAIELTNRTTQDLRSETVKALRNLSDDSRAGRSIIMQSIGNLLEEISSLRKSVERLPDLLQSSIQPVLQANVKPEVTFDNEPVIAEIDGVSERIDTLTQGIKAFFETYAENHENTVIPETLRPSVDSEALTGIEGLIRAEGKSHSTGLAELSREISALVEENNTALLHEVREIISEAENDSGNEHETSSHSPSHTKMLKLTVLLSASSIILLIINIIIFLLK
ncbi:MAG: hypothetical protein IJG36_01095 [Synergistaceae bacterium]|nr:hypothetical protein [Synergistaceae bacterium]MBR0167382.1 hypothetical protein [Synergistaceae bacterium]